MGNHSEETVETISVALSVVSRCFCLVSGDLSLLQLWLSRKLLQTAAQRTLSWKSMYFELEVEVLRIEVLRRVFCAAKYLRLEVEILKKYSQNTSEVLLCWSMQLHSLCIWAWVLASPLSIRLKYLCPFGIIHSVVLYSSWGQSFNARWKCTAECICIFACFHQTIIILCLTLNIHWCLLVVGRRFNHSPH
jgi:hypothetical protein